MQDAKDRVVVDGDIFFFKIENFKLHFHIETLSNGKLPQHKRHGFRTVQRCTCCNHRVACSKCRREPIPT